ncbi:hypothetical protein [Paenibacillus agricola]|uniref:Spore coat protein n=1 Tax=Paenibacillus agricola TaxID=2716264 RepID=A0ABX0IYM9_9BACL|nr:hypothetical protein [Paenibacillus agricola]NHN29075.1 hypothetical protein [Paenibacillus agricola]
MKPLLRTYNRMERMKVLDYELGLILGVPLSETTAQLNAMSTEELVSFTDDLMRIRVYIHNMNSNPEQETKEKQVK